MNLPEHTTLLNLTIIACSRLQLIQPLDQGNMLLSLMKSQNEHINFPTKLSKIWMTSWNTDKLFIK